MCGGSFVVVAVESRSLIWLSATLWAAAWQSPLPFTVSWSLLKLKSIESMMPSSHLVLCHPFSSCPQFPQHQWLFQWVGSSHQVTKVLWARISQKKRSSPHSQQKSPKCRTWVQCEKQQNDLRWWIIDMRNMEAECQAETDLLLCLSVCLSLSLLVFSALFHPRTLLLASTWPHRWSRFSGQEHEGHLWSLPFTPGEIHLSSKQGLTHRRKHLWDLVIESWGGC